MSNSHTYSTHGKYNRKYGKVMTGVWRSDSEDPKPQQKSTSKKKPMAGSEPTPEQCQEPEVAVTPEEIDDRIMNLPTYALCLTFGTHNILRDNKLKYLRDLCKRTPDDLLNMRRIAPFMVLQIRRELASLGLTLAGDTPPAPSERTCAPEAEMRSLVNTHIHLENLSKKRIAALENELQQVRKKLKHEKETNSYLREKLSSLYTAEGK